MARTTIQVDEKTKSLIDERKLEGESYDSALNRILSDSGTLHTDAEIREIVREEIELWKRQSD